jgi:hypothetical protein
MHKSVERDLITCGEAAGILGISLQAVHQGLRKGIVRHQLVNGRKMIERDRLVQRWKGVSDEEALAARCNSYLDLSAWGAPPFTADQWATLRVIIDLME